jgi:uncharacterized protein YkwD
MFGASAPSGGVDTSCYSSAAQATTTFATTTTTTQLVPVEGTTANVQTTPTIQIETTSIPSTSRVTDLEWEHFNLVNQLRADGFFCPSFTYFAPNPQPLIFECKLWRASQLHSLDMAQNLFLSHTSQDGRSSSDRAAAVGASADAENIAVGGSTAQAILNQWRISDADCRNMGQATFRYFAVGHATSSIFNYWTQMFGANSPSGGVDTSCYPSSVQATSMLAATTTPTKEGTTVSMHTASKTTSTTSVSPEQTTEVTTKLSGSSPIEVVATTTGGLVSTPSGSKVATVLRQSVVIAALDSLVDTESFSSAFAVAMSTATGKSIKDISVSVVSAKLTLVYSQLPSNLDISHAKSAIARINNVAEDAVVVSWTTQRRRLGLKSVRRLAQTASADIIFNSDETSGVDVLAKVKTAKESAHKTEFLAAEIKKLTGNEITPPVLMDGTSVVVSTRTEILSSTSEAGQSFAAPSVIERVGQIIGAEVVMESIQVIVSSTSSRQGETFDPAIIAGAQQSRCVIIAYTLLLVLASGLI